MLQLQFSGLLESPGQMHAQQKQPSLKFDFLAYQQRYTATSEATKLMVF
jgi:hypothetical protein